MHDLLIKHINQHLARPLKAQEEKAVVENFLPKAYRRRQFLLQAGDTSSRNSFVVQGCFRVFVTDAKGKDHNLQFAIENPGNVSNSKIHPEFSDGAAPRLRGSLKVMIS